MEQEAVEEEHVSDSEGSQSSVSYDEGSYDGREGKIVYQCKDDESIQEGAPGARMFDQNIRETCVHVLWSLLFIISHFEDWCLNGWLNLYFHKMFYL